MHRIARWGFWSALGLLLYTYGIFPLVTLARGRLVRQPVHRGDATPTVSFIIAAYNEEANIVGKLDNLFALDYPRSHLRVIVASDGSDDQTNDLVARYPAAEVQLLALPRRGKNYAINSAAAIAAGELLVFSDADSILEPDALRVLVAPFADPLVGGVGGDHRHPPTGEGEAGERAYWNADRLLKDAQSRSGSTTSVTGSLYAIRRGLYRPVPAGVLDDFFNLTSVLRAHRRMVFEPRAVAHGPIAASLQSEFRRKVRMTTRGLRTIWLARALLNPFAYGTLAVQLASHRALRWLASLPLLVLATTAPLLWGQGRIYQLATVGQLGLHVAAALGFLLRATPVGQLRMLRLPLFVDMVHVAGLLALLRLLRGRQQDVWTRQ